MEAYQEIHVDSDCTLRPESPSKMVSGSLFAVCDLRHLQLCHSMADLDKVPEPKVKWNTFNSQTPPPGYAPASDTIFTIS